MSAPTPWKSIWRTALNGYPLLAVEFAYHEVRITALGWWWRAKEALQAFRVWLVWQIVREILRLVTFLCQLVSVPYHAIRCLRKWWRGEYD